MELKTKIAGLMMALMALSAPLVYADNGGGDENSWHQGSGDWHHGQGNEMVAKILNLSPDQEKQLQANHQQQRDTMKGIFEQMKANREAFDAEIIKATPDMNKLNDIQSQLKTIQAQMADNRLNSVLAIKKILTPEQFAGYMTLKKERELRMHKGFNKFGPKGEMCKMGNGQKHWGDKPDADHDSEE